MVGPRMVVRSGQAAEPWGLTAVLDPAGLRFIHDIGPAGAGGGPSSLVDWMDKETQKAGGCVDLWWFMMIYDDLSI